MLVFIHTYELVYQCILKTCSTLLEPATLVLALLWVDDDEVLTLLSGRSWRSSWAVAVS